MKNWFKKIKYFILSVREKSLSNRLKPHLEKSFGNKTSKTIISGSETVVLNSETKKKISETSKNVADIAKNCDENPQKLIDYVKAKGTKIFRIKNAGKILSKIGEEEGLITELQGTKALILNFFTVKKFSLHSEPMFVLDTDNIEYYYLLREFYKWYSLYMGLDGFNFSAQENFKKYLT